MSMTILGEIIIVLIFCASCLDGTAPECDETYLYRSIDGSCNNLHNPDWGKANTPFKRFVKAGGGKMLAYVNDGEPRGGLISLVLKSPGIISDMVSNQSVVNEDADFDNKRSLMHAAVGQYFSHEFANTEMTDKEDLVCCKNGQPSYQDECFPIYNPSREENDKKCMHFVRSKSEPSSTGSHPEQLNKDTTSYIDLSPLYGSTEKKNKQIRKQKSCLLKTDGKFLLPTAQEKKSDFCVKSLKKGKCPFGGDDRVNEMTQLSLLHMAFIALHNKVCDELTSLNPDWDFEKRYQEARKICIASWQKITYSEYIPQILDDTTMNKYELNPTPSGYNYNTAINAATTNAAAHAMRHGHSQVRNSQPFCSGGDKCDNIKNIDITKLFHNAKVLQKKNGINMKRLASGLVTMAAMKIDGLVVDGLRTSLFENFETATDLVARNIQRGRDHGLPQLNEWRTFCDLDPYTDFNAFDKCPQLSEVYSNIEDVDLFIGGLCESKNGFVGETFACILGKQFHNYKFGDRFWYETTNEKIGFTSAQLTEIRKATLAWVLCKTNLVTKIQPNALNIPEDYINEVKLCKDIPKIDFNEWKDVKYEAEEERELEKEFEEIAYKLSHN